MSTEFSDHSRTTVIFDRDGTLLDFYDMFYTFILDMHQEQGVAPPSRAEILSLEYWQSLAGGRLCIGTVVVRDRVDDVVRRYMSHGRLYPGAADTVRRLADAGVRLVLVSGWVGTAATELLLAEHGIRQAFQDLVTRDDLPSGGRRLSDEDCKILLARDSLNRIGHRPGDPLFVVGDSPADVALGRTLEAVVVGVRTGNGARLLTGMLTPTVMIDSAADVADIVLGSDSSDPGLGHHDASPTASAGYSLPRIAHNS